MATKKTVARAASRSKKSPRAAKSAGPEYVKIRKDEVDRCRSLLKRAQREAVMAAPRSIPRIGSWGAEAAICAFDTIYIADAILAAATEVAP